MNKGVELSSFLKFLIVIFFFGVVGFILDLGGMVDLGMEVMS